MLQEMWIPSQSRLSVGKSREEPESDGRIPMGENLPEMESEWKEKRKLSPLATAVLAAFQT